MATKGVLTEAIKKLEYANANLKLALKAIKPNTKSGKEITAKIARNESMILDYQFRLKHE